ETSGLERIVIELEQDKVDHMDWDKIHVTFVGIYGPLRTKKQLQEKWRNYLKSDVKLADGERFVFSAQQIDYIKAQRDTFGKSWAEIRDDLNKNPDMKVKTTPNRVKNAYHNATKKQLRHQRQNVSASVKSPKSNPNVHNENALTELKICSDMDTDMNMDSEPTKFANNKIPISSLLNEAENDKKL
ncbi:2279_t:CDS:2, partial [Cetraspora pellucida]